MRDRVRSVEKNLVVPMLLIVSFGPMGASGAVLKTPPSDPPICASEPRSRLTQKIDKLIRGSKIGPSATIGVTAIDLKTGKPLVCRNADTFFIPASNTKLFTTAAALTKLGPDFTVSTSIAYVGADLVIYGRGDPNLSGRPIPYQQPAPGTTARPTKPLAAIEAIADELIAKNGVKEIRGNIIADDSIYLWQPFAEGIAADDPVDPDGAPVSAFSVDDNSVTMKVEPGAQVYDAARITIEPIPDLFEVNNRLLTVTAGSTPGIFYDRLPGSRTLRVWGSIPVDGRSREILLAVSDPAEFAAKALRLALEQRGVAVRGGAMVRHREHGNYMPGAPPETQNAVVALLEHPSAPLLEWVRVTNQVSQNLHAELLLRALCLPLATDARPLPVEQGSRELALSQLDNFLQEAGIAKTDYDFYDGSGLSRLNLVKPRAVLQLLRYMDRSALAQQWESTLPTGGVDGTIAKRFTTEQYRGRIHAKTGALMHNSALSGFADGSKGQRIAFSIFVGNYHGTAVESRMLIDKITEALVQ